MAAFPPPPAGVPSPALRGPAQAPRPPRPAPQFANHMQTILADLAQGGQALRTTQPVAPAVTGAPQLPSPWALPAAPRGAVHLAGRQQRRAAYPNQAQLQQAARQMQPAGVPAAPPRAGLLGRQMRL